MFSRYKKIKEDSRFSAAEDRGHYSDIDDSVVKTIVFYLLLTSSNSLYLQDKWSLRNLNELR